MPLGITASMTLQQQAAHARLAERRRASSKAAIPARKNEYVVYTAHWDHFGKRPEGIFHGAQDDALGCASLIEIGAVVHQAAVAAAPVDSLPCRHRRRAGAARVRVLHRDADLPAGEDGGRHQLDSWNVSGRTKDLTLVGLGASDLDDYVRGAAAEQGRVVHGDAEPREGLLLPIGPFQLREAGRAGAVRRKAASTTSASLRTTDGRCARSGRRIATTSQPMSCGLTGISSGAREDLKVYFAVGDRVGAGRELSRMESRQRIQGEARRHAEEMTAR